VKDGVPLLFFLIKYFEYGIIIMKQGKGINLGNPGSPIKSCNGITRFKTARE
jgi:hypothetical protein